MKHLLPLLVLVGVASGGGCKSQDPNPSFQVSFKDINQAIAADLPLAKDQKAWTNTVLELNIKPRPKYPAYPTFTATVNSTKKDGSQKFNFQVEGKMQLIYRDWEGTFQAARIVLTKVVTQGKELNAEEQLPVRRALYTTALFDRDLIKVPKALSKQAYELSVDRMTLQGDQLTVHMKTPTPAEKEKERAKMKAEWNFKK